MQLARSLRHLFATRAGTRRCFDDAVMNAVDEAIRAAESRTSGEIRFAIETALEMPELWNGVTPRERALHVFSSLHVWNTELRNGVLIYILRADRDVEIVADRGAAGAVTPAEWEAVCRLMETEFRAGRFREGALAGVAAVGSLLARHFPARRADRDELPNQPILL
jgi:uncharacterized membrane protein